MRFKDFINEAKKERKYYPTVKIGAQPTQMTPDMQINDLEGFQEAELIKDVPNIEVMIVPKQLSKIYKKEKITVKKGWTLFNGDKGILLNSKPPQKVQTYVIASPDNAKKLLKYIKPLK